MGRLCTIQNVVPLLDSDLFKSIAETGRDFTMRSDFVWILWYDELRATYRNNLEPVHWAEPGRPKVIADAILNEQGEALYQLNKRQSLLNKEEFMQMREGILANSYKDTYFAWFIDIRDGFAFVDFAARDGKNHGYILCEAYKKPNQL